MAIYFRKSAPFLLVGFVALAVLFVFAVNSQAQEIDKERALQIVAGRGGPGGCDSEASCAEFCDTNFEACAAWARDNGVISDDDFQKHSEFVQQGGPGGCRTPNECKSYCDSEEHFDECIEFGQKQGLISEEQAQRARRTGPGGCRTQKECNTFCEQPQNHDVCIDHAVQEGFMTREEAERIKEFRSREADFRKRSEGFRQRSESRRPEPQEIDPGFDEERARQLISTQGGPGGCNTFQECERFCNNPDNQQACFAFAEEHQLFTNREQFEKMKRIMQEGGPGGCRGEQECEQFCESPDNFEVCITFAEKHGLIPPEEVEMAKKGIRALREGGPLGCKTQQECDRVCNDPANQEACFEWGKKHGLIPEEELRFHEEARQLREEFDRRREEFERQHEENFRPGEGPENFGPPREEFRGPGGCQGPEECERYCGEHPDECAGFGPSEEHNIQREEFQEPEFHNLEEPRFEEPGFEESPTFDPAIKCSESGGIWTGAFCEFPQREEFQPLDDSSFSEPREFQEEPRPEEFHEPEPEQEPTSLREHRFLGAIYRFLLR